MPQTRNRNKNSALAIALSVSIGGMITEVQSQSVAAQPYRPSFSCPPKHIATTPQGGCVPDRSAEFEMGKGKYARSLTLPSVGVNTVPPRGGDGVNSPLAIPALPKKPNTP